MQLSYGITFMPSSGFHTVPHDPFLIYEHNVQQSIELSPAYVQEARDIL